MDESEIRIWLTLPHNMVASEKLSLLPCVKKCEIHIYVFVVHFFVLKCNVWTESVKLRKLACLVQWWILDLFSWTGRIFNTFIAVYRCVWPSVFYTSDFIHKTCAESSTSPVIRANPPKDLRIHHIIKQLFSSTFRSYMPTSSEEKSEQNDIMDWKSLNVVKWHIYPYC